MYGLLLCYLVARYKYGLPFHDSPSLSLQFTVSWWTISRPFVFSVVWLIVFASLTSLNQISGYLAAIALTGALAIYAFSLDGIRDFYESWQQSFLPKPFLLKFYGFNEWDIVRGGLLIIIAVYLLVKPISSTADRICN
jgi:hypothetical protein